MISICYKTSGSVFGHPFSYLPFLRLMVRKFRVRIAFEPSRLGAEHLENAYEFVVPVVRRQICKAPVADVQPAEQHQHKTEKQA